MPKNVGCISVQHKCCLHSMVAVTCLLSASLTSKCADTSDGTASALAIFVCLYQQNLFWYQQDPYIPTGAKLYLQNPKGTHTVILSLTKCLNGTAIVKRATGTWQGGEATGKIGPIMADRLSLHTSFVYCLTETCRVLIQSTHGILTLLNSNRSQTFKSKLGSRATQTVTKSTRTWNMISSPATPTVCLEQKYENFQSRNVMLSMPSQSQK